VDEMLAVLLKVGPLGRILRENPALQDAAAPRLRAALEARNANGRVLLDAAVWIVAASA
jgi:hypothetical protein